jgi:lysozyme
MARTDPLLLALVGLTVGAALVEWFSQPRVTDYADSLPPPEDNPFDTAPMSATTYFQPIARPMNASSPAAMRTSAAGLQNIVRWEGRRNQAYTDVSGNWTIGIGHKIVAGDGLTPQSVLADTTVDAIFANDIEDAENIVKSVVTVPLTQGQFDALVDFAFQFGTQLNSSTLLKKLNAGDYAGAAMELTRWVHSRTPAGQLVTVPQLVARRETAATMFA